MGKIEFLQLMGIPTEPVVYKTSEIVKEAKALQKEYPEAKYKFSKTSHENSVVVGCDYFSGGVSKGPKTRGCLVGQAISRAYPSLRQEINSKGHTGSTISDIITEYDICGSKRDQEYLEKIQFNQDSGVEWGKCSKKQPLE